MSLCLYFTSDVIPFDQNWHHLYSTSAGGKHLSNDAQIKQAGGQPLQQKENILISAHARARL